MTYELLVFFLLFKYRATLIVSVSALLEYMIWELLPIILIIGTLVGWPSLCLIVCDHIIRVLRNACPEVRVRSMT